ncbi:MAG: methyltransferase domain-containing protein [Chloroflexi bacterium]|nr:MAG: methyltransferase domain-containing protein [Chloroflexota bacterium]
MIKNTISPEAARRFYDRLGAGHDRAEMYESRAKQVGLERLALSPGLRLLNVGVGTGKEHRLLVDGVGPTGLPAGIDLSPVMLRLTRDRTAAPLCQADARRLPFRSGAFDRLFSAYVLDLIPLDDLPGLLAEMRRVLRPGGRLVLVSLTEGVNLPSRAIVGLWKLLYAASPVACGGCRPVQLAGLVRQAGFQQVSREVVVQLAVPSEVITAEHPA